ncbi:sensor histidine kinase [Actinoplanes friuliensis]|uniref:histidine kinase n=1 Tax=Actinoplanes friuliensis DSM 7358 TaxID=1246995 RepID=U5W5Y4_9ACTN|nr:ATP-binding protein [Actinoplanes friuliensis]AGZ43361.1 integral membrane sensor signal transduction histidine kinase [Actinoplanes friuliensis DSM 7358]
MSLRSRLVILFAAGTSVVLALGLSLLYLALDRQLTAAVDADLRGRAADLISGIAAGDRTAVAADPMAQLFATDGALLTGTSSLPGPLLDPARVRATTTPSLVRTQLPIGYRSGPVRVRLLAEPVGATGEVLAVAVASGGVERGSDRQLTVLLVAAPVLVAVLAALGWLLVRAALRPVDALTREAAAISTLDSARRLPAVSGSDEIARLAATLDDMLGRLAVSFARERAFVDDASHELRTPVAVLRGEIDLALSALDDSAEVEQSLRAAQDQVARLARLTEDLLVLARERGGSLVVHREPVDLADLVRAEARMPVSVRGEPVVVEADADRLRQVIANLAANSTAAGATRADVRIGTETGAAVLEWSDDGPGFAPEVLASAFERFVRGDPARSAAPGSGLGLSIVRAIAIAHGGTATARNAPTDGAVVTVRLPGPFRNGA